MVCIVNEYNEQNVTPTTKMFIFNVYKIQFKRTQYHNFNFNLKLKQNVTPTDKMFIFDVQFMDDVVNLMNKVVNRSVEVSVRDSYAYEWQIEILDLQVWKPCGKVVCFEDYVHRIGFRIMHSEL
ncbi:hypothetical protein M5689_001011 [Euphorbia peplus]|nr:hypothetical protein M5689_001011 [Euphorbia peplus]